jgi:hypothetical protein
MTKDEALAIVDYVASVWPAPEMTGQAKAVYAHAILDLEADDVNRAIVVLARIETWRPAPAAVRAEVARHQGSYVDPEAIAEAGWAEVTAGTAPTHPAALTACRQLGGLRALVTSERPQIDRARFARIVADAVERQNRTVLAADHLAAPRTLGSPSPLAIGAILTTTTTEGEPE